MLALDADLFLALNATPATPAAVLAAARWLSQDLPVFAGLLMVLELARGNPATRRAVAWGVFSLLVAWCTVRGFRALFPVPRPAQLGLGIQWIEMGARASFPSMHTAAAFALARGLTLGLARGQAPGWRWLAYALAAALGWSRVCLGVHMPSDVIAGALVGACSAWVAGRAAQAWISRRGKFSAYWFRPGRPSAPRR
ncbi:phosphatase PAP2 family protein [Paracidovorax anthurii]|uniref:Undecaprenyl-diphosphatase n=1 Tax=Paracidovorax anthurii TaxID=78229 RepID=A0A328Z587_9BURK|nr:phosphatase PAP2 family protein [Paracidovorax anthurii]RAR77396.1 undecaprenyl-diphosphatase [Paracidovorax anthurii]